MNEHYTSIFTEEERAARRRQRQEARKAKLRARRRRQLMLFLPCALLTVLAVGLLLGSKAAGGDADDSADVDLSTQKASAPTPPVVEDEIPDPTSYTATADTVQLDETFPSVYAVLIDLDSHEILAQKDADAVIYPASMTKILTVLVAAEAIQEADLDDTFSMTREITDYCYVNGCSVVGLMVD